MKKNIKNSIVFSSTQRLIIDKLIENYKSSNPEGEKYIRNTFTRYCEKSLLITSEGYDRNWERLYIFHCYNLLLNQLGIDVLDGEPLSVQFGEWRRHHWKFNKESINLADLILVSNSKHASAYSHFSRPLASIRPENQSELLGKYKQIINNLIQSYLDSMISVDQALSELPSSWSEVNKIEFLDRLDFLKVHGDNEFIKEFFKGFYEFSKDNIIIDQ